MSTMNAVQAHQPVIAQTFPLAQAALAYGPAPTPRRPGPSVLVVRS
jgi:hypothetical protein